jgi:hypothetical protein
MPPAAQAPSAAQLAANSIAQNNAARTLILRGGMVGNQYQPPAINMWQPLVRC